MRWTVFGFCIIQACFWLYVFLEGSGGSEYYRFGGKINYFLVLLLIASILGSILCAFLQARGNLNKSFLGLWFTLRKAEMEKRLAEIDTNK